MFGILEFLTPPPQIRVIDVGARCDPECPEVYLPLVRAGCASVLGFEPNRAECDRLNSSGEPGRRYLPYAIGEGDRRTLRVCADSRTSSLYEPNAPLLAYFNNLAEPCRVVDRVEVRTVALDAIEEARGADYLKLDVQGAEADVLRGARNVLEDVLVVHAEVEFVPLYRDQPLFGDIDALLRAHGFLFHKFPGFASRAFRPIVVNGDLNRGLSQMLWAEAVYVKSFLAFDRLEAAKLLKLAVILHEVYGSYDLCALALRHYDARLADAYVQKLVGRPEKNIQAGGSRSDTHCEG